ncbi:hypothetical protein Tco_1034928 [Tanacetum coccineum]
MSWSKDSQYICTRNDSMPTVLWIWDMNLLELLHFSVMDLKWDFNGSCLLLKDKDSFCCAAVPLLPDDSNSDYSSDD